MHWLTFSCEKHGELSEVAVPENEKKEAVLGGMLIAHGEHHEKTGCMAKIVCRSGRMQAEEQKN